MNSVKYLDFLRKIAISIYVSASSISGVVLEHDCVLAIIKFLKEVHEISLIYCIDCNILH